MKLSKISISLMLFFSFIENSLAQSPENALENIRLNYASEKIFIHYDKGSYVAGETVWFKAYFLLGFLPSMLSSSVNVELINDSGRIIDKKILPIVNSSAAGNFMLPADLPEANYTIRAYTIRSMNFGSNYFYFHQLPVFNPSTSRTTAIPEKEFTLYLLPESGNLIGGIKNIVAFKCTDQWGYPADAEGTIVNSTGATITSFNTVHDGMGKFEISPENGETYTAVSLLGKTASKKIILPPSIASGTLLSIRKENNKTYFYVNSETVSDENLEPAYILAVIENTVIFKIDLPADQKNFKGSIPVADIPSGIMQVTLFNKRDQPLAERLLFIRNKDFIANGKLNLDTLSTAGRAKNVYSFELQDSIDGNYSVAITDPDKEIGQNDNDNIYSRFLVTNDIRGYVYNPQYYFEADDEKRTDDLDLVMLTNGWRKFTWNEILSKRLPLVRYKDPNYISIKGLAYEDGSNKPTGETNLSVFIKTKDFSDDLMIVPVNKESALEIPGLVFRDTATLFFQNLYGKNKKTIIQPNVQSLSEMFKLVVPSRFSPVKPLSFIEGNDKVKNLYVTSLNNLDKKSILLQEVRVVTKAKNPTKLLEERYIRNGVFNSYAAKTIDLVNDPSGTNNTSNVFEYLKARVGGVNVSGQGGNYTLNYRGNMSLRTGPIPMALFLDESQVSSSTDISVIPMSQIAMIKIYSPGFVGSEGGSPGGVLSVYTKKGDDTYNVPGMDNLFRMKVEGYSPVKEFFSPDYAAGKANFPTEDNRSTLYWDPYLETDPSNKKFSFSFYNADHVKKFRLVLEGMTSDGKLLHIEKVIE